MAIYSVDKLISETRRIAKEYRLATGKILPVTPGQTKLYDPLKVKREV